MKVGDQGSALKPARRRCLLDLRQRRSLCNPIRFVPTPSSAREQWDEFQGLGPWWESLRLSPIPGTSCESPAVANRCPDHSQHGIAWHGRGKSWAVRRQTSGPCGQRAAGIDAERAHAVPAATGERSPPVRAVRPFCGQSGGDGPGDADQHGAAHRPAGRRAACAGDHGHHRPAVSHARGQQARLRPRRQ